MTSEGRATTEKRVFSRATSVSVTIKATPAAVWTVLTNAARYPAWNSTVVSLNGSIGPDSRIELVSTLDPSRTFKLKVKDFDPPRRLIWGDALGTRTYTLTQTGDGRTLFEMRERIGGPLFPLFASKIPSFDASFEQFAADLKAAAEPPGETQG